MGTLPPNIKELQCLKTKHGVLALPNSSFDKHTAPYTFTHSFSICIYQQHIWCAHNESALQSLGIRRACVGSSATLAASRQLYHFCACNADRFTCSFNAAVVGVILSIVFPLLVKRYRLASFTLLPSNVLQ